MAEPMTTRERRLVADAFRSYAAERFEAYLENPEVSWIEQPFEMAKRYAKIAADLRAHADRIEEASNSEEADR